MPKELPSLDKLQQEIEEAKSQLGGQKRKSTPIPQTVGGQAMQMATRFIIGAALGAGGGYLLDDWLSTSPLCFLAGFFIGFAGGVYSLMLAIRKKK